MSHVYQGLCPDESQPDASDPACPACLEMQAGKAALAENKALRRLLTRAVKIDHCDSIKHHAFVAKVEAALKGGAK